MVYDEVKQNEAEVFFLLMLKIAAPEESSFRIVRESLLLPATFL